MNDIWKVIIDLCIVNNDFNIMFTCKDFYKLTKDNELFIKKSLFVQFINSYLWITINHRFILHGSLSVRVSTDENAKLSYSCEMTRKGLTWQLSECSSTAKRNKVYLNIFDSIKGKEDTYIIRIQTYNDSLSHCTLKEFISIGIIHNLITTCDIRTRQLSFTFSNLTKSIDTLRSLIINY